MLINESEWIKRVLVEKFGPDDFPLLNVGSSSLDFREQVQPHIGDLFAFLAEEKKQVIHTDIKDELGVDIVGDLLDKEFRLKLMGLGVNSIMCSNLLEHLKDPKDFSESIVDTLRKGGMIIVTVPRSFPYHKDPIDTMLRPTAEELHAFFPGTEIIESEEIFDDRSYWDDLKANKKYFALMVVRWCLPFYKFRDWKRMVKDLFNSKKKYSVTALLLKKV